MTLGAIIISGKYKVVGIKKIINHGEYFSNSSISYSICAVGKRGGIVTGHIFTNGKIIINKSSEFFKFEGESVYNGTTGVETKGNEAVEVIEDVYQEEVIEVVTVEKNKVDTSNIVSTLAKKFGIGSEVIYSGGNLHIKVKHRFSVSTITTAIRFHHSYTSSYNKDLKQHVISIPEININSLCILN